MTSGQHPKQEKLRLKDFDFGDIDAHAEAAHRPDLLLRGFIDDLGIINEARNGRKFLFLGYKGSGKSALAEHLSLLTEPELFVKVVHIADLSFANLYEIVEGGGEPEARFPTAWSWLLLLQLFDSFSKDLGSNLNDDEHLWYVVETLKGAGFLPDAKLTKTLETTLKTTYALKLGDIVNIGRERTVKSDANLPCLVESLKRHAAAFKSDSRHLLIIDGLDDLLRSGKLEHTALRCLLFEAQRLNNEFVKSDTPAKIIVLCRTDLFNRLPGANNNKLRAAYAVNLDWSDHLSDPKHTGLVQIINRRASIGRDVPIDVFDSFLPKTIDANERNPDIRGQLLEHTRRLPRDVVMLFKHLQEHSGDTPMTRSQVFNGLAAYSRDYLVPEMMDELGGYADPSRIQMAVSLFTKVRKRAVSVPQLEDRANQLGYPEKFRLREMLRVLFECSLIGTGPSIDISPKYAQFRFKNRYATFDPYAAVFFHRGLWNGLDLHQ